MIRIYKSNIGDTFGYNVCVHVEKLLFEAVIIYGLKQFLPERLQLTEKNRKYTKRIDKFDEMVNKT